MVSNALNEFQCSAIAGGLLFSWGAGAYGALGRGNISDYNTPVQIGAASDWTWISRKIFYGACGLRGGKAFTWGFNNYGQIGNGNVGTTYSSPVQIGAATDWKLIMCGDENTMGIRLV